MCAAAAFATTTTRVTPLFKNKQLFASSLLLLRHRPLLTTLAPPPTMQPLSTTTVAPAAAAENVNPQANANANAKMSAAAANASAPPAKKQATEPALRVRRLTDAAQLPVRGSALAAGYDVSSAEDTEIPARGKALVSTGLVVAVPEGTYGRVAPRSGLAWKHFIDVGAGVIDADYRGELKVLLFNHSDVAFKGESFFSFLPGSGGERPRSHARRARTR
jgi:dUTP pyrophosphatase